MSDLDFSVIITALPLLSAGFLYSIQLTFVATVGGIFFGTLLALARRGSRPVALIATGYVNLMRSIPLLLVIFSFYLVLPLVLQRVFGLSQPPRIGAEMTAYITFTLFEAAYFSEIIRAGIGSIAKGQGGAAAALGLSPVQVMRYVVMPQAFRAILPMLLTQVIVLFQDVSLVSLLNVTDIVGAATKVAQRDGRVVEMYLAVAFAYLITCLLLSRLAGRLRQRLSATAS